MSTPKVSVIMPTYNHAPFVSEAITSVLAQDYGDFEFIIADDGSTDGTNEVVREFKDKRIKFTDHRINRGAGIVTNELVSRATGGYVAIINSDDVWIQGKLSMQMTVLEENPGLGACFGRADFIGPDGKRVLKNSLPFGNVFDKKNRSRGKWLRRFFDMGNCICHPTMLIRRSCYDRCGLYNNRYRQLPDFEMWIRLVKVHDIFISDESLIRFRIVPGENASSQTHINTVRTLNEHFLIAETFFDEVDRKILLEGFSDLLTCKDIPTPAHLDIEKALLYLVPNQWLGAPYGMIGLQKLFHLLNSDEHRAILAREYEIDDRWYQARMGEIDTLQLRPAAGNVSPGLFQRILGAVKLRMN